MILVGIAGRAGAGKDTVGDILIRDYGFAATHFAFRLKQMISDLLGEGIERWADRDWRETVHPRSGQTPRYMAQTLGTEWGRETISSTLWIDDTFRRLDGGKLPRVAITDLRFENEASHIRARGGRVIHVKRPDGQEMISTADHPSERGILVRLADFEIENGGTLADLEEEIAEIVGSILTRDTRSKECRASE